MGKEFFGNFFFFFVARVKTGFYYRFFLIQKKKRWRARFIEYAIMGRESREYDSIVALLEQKIHRA